MYIYIYTHVYTYMYIHTCIYIYIYIHIRWGFPAQYDFPTTPGIHDVLGSLQRPRTFPLSLGSAKSAREFPI